MTSVSKVFKRVHRENFLPDDQKQSAHINTPLPIGFGQTNSQPSTVKQMLEWLNVYAGHTVLDVGSGSGWTSALLSELTGPKGKVFAVELVPELVERGRGNCKNARHNNISFFLAVEEYGLPEFAPYDRILVSASADSLPTELVDQLRVGGKLVIPVKNDVLEITKTSKHEFDTDIHSGFVFVPLLPKRA